MSIPVSFLSSGTAIVQRLRDRMSGDVKAVRTRADMTLKADLQTVPAVYVVYAGHRAVGTEYGTTYTLRWIVVIAVANQVNTKETSTADDRASPLIDTLLEALNGFAPPGHTPLVGDTPPPPAYPDQFAYFPFQFSTDLEYCFTPDYSQR